MRYEFEWENYENGARDVRAKTYAGVEAQEYTLRILKDGDAFQVLKTPGGLMATISVPDVMPRTIEDAFIAHVSGCAYKVRCYRRNGDLSHEMLYKTLEDAEAERTRWGHHIGLRPEPSGDFAFYPTIWEQECEGWKRLPGY